MYLFRLDDASEYMDVDKWNRIEAILDKYSVQPLVGVIPHNEDQDIVPRYNRDETFWTKASAWKEKGWRIAQHGYNHVYATRSGGINPVNKKSEFAGLPLERQQEKIRAGYQILCSRGLKPDIFFAPSHTFDVNTLEALKTETDIRIISDTFANNVYREQDFYYIPQQTCKPRQLPFHLTTICFHPNKMKDAAFTELESFISKNRNSIVPANNIVLRENPLSVYDKILRSVYFSIKKIKG